MGAQGYQWLPKVRMGADGWLFVVAIVWRGDARFGLANWLGSKLGSIRRDQTRPSIPTQMDRFARRLFFDS